MSNIDRYAVVGNPISHSQSPYIHSCFAEQSNQLLYYGMLDPVETAFKQTVEDFFQNKGKGLSVTAPFKLQAYALAEYKTLRAQQAKSVNVLWMQDHCIYGDNTDGCGLVRDLHHNYKFNLRNKEILFIGAGGATSGSIGAFLSENPKKITIMNRTHHKAVMLARYFSQFNSSTEIVATPIDAEIAYFDLIINTTFIRDNHFFLKKTTHNKQAMYYDMVYAPDNKGFKHWCYYEKENQFCDGLGMLVEQAAEQFYIWTSVHPKTDIVLQLLRKTLNN